MVRNSGDITRANVVEAVEEEVDAVVEEEVGLGSRN